MSIDLTDVLGTTCVDHDGKRVEVSSLANKTVMLYFSAHWCPPCRAFTPKLVEFYEGLKKTSSAQLEVVFVSSDRDKHGFDEYFGSMPWLAAPYPPSESAGDAFGISGIPTLVVLEVGADVRAAKVITKDGRAKVMRDPRGESFPWKR